MPGEARRRSAELRRPHARPHAIGRDENAGSGAAARPEIEPHAIRLRRHGRNLGPGHDLHPGLPRPLRQKIQQVGTMKLPVGPPVARHRRRPERQTHHLTPGTVIAQFDGLRHARMVLGRAAQPERLENRDGVRADLQTRTHFAQRSGPLVDPHPRLALRQRGCRRQPADSGADDGDLRSLEIHAPRPVPHGPTRPSRRF